MSDLNQIVLFDGESDEALLLPRADRHKRYTADQAKNLDWKEDAIVVMLAASVIPLEVISETVHVNFRTVQAIAARNTELIGQNAAQFSAYAQGKSAKWMGMADQKADKASFKDLMIGSGIARDTAINLRLAGLGGEEAARAIEVENESPTLAAIRKRLAAGK